MHQPMMGRRTFVKGGLAASALAALAACGKKSDKDAGSGSATTGKTKGGTFNYYINNPVSIDPYDAEEDQGMQVIYQLFDALTTYDFDKGELKGLAAESWKGNDTADEFTFKLVKGAKFHDGTTVDAQSFKRAWERICNPKTSATTKSKIAFHLAMVEGYKEMMAGTATEMSGLTCPDENTLVVKLIQPYADFPYVCMHPALSPVPEVALKDFDTYFLAPVGNGPFKMDGEWKDGQEINLVRFDDYSYGDKANLDGIHFNIQKDPKTAYSEFEAGNLDFALVPTSQIKDAVSKYGESEDGYTISSGKDVLLGAELSTYYIVLNMKDATMQDLDLRRALSLAINRQAICDTVFDGTREPAGGVIPPKMAGYQENTWEYCKYDVDAANKLLDAKYPKDANGKRNVTIQLSYNLDGDHKTIMEMVLADWDKIGVTGTSVNNDWATTLKDYAAGNFQAGRLGWNADYPIMDNFMYSLFVPGADNNYGKYDNPAVEKGISEARAILDDDKRIAKFQEVDKIVQADMPIIPIMYYKHNFVASSRVKHLYLDPQKLCTMSTIEMSSK